MADKRTGKKKKKEKLPVTETMETNEKAPVKLSKKPKTRKK